MVKNGLRSKTCINYIFIVFDLVLLCSISIKDLVLCQTFFLFPSPVYKQFPPPPFCFLLILLLVFVKYLTCFLNFSFFLFCVCRISIIDVYTPDGTPEGTPFVEVTGKVLSGTIREGDELVVLPNQVMF